MCNWDPHAYELYGFQQGKLACPKIQSYGTDTLFRHPRAQLIACLSLLSSLGPAFVSRNICTSGGVILPLSYYVRSKHKHLIAQLQYDFPDSNRVYCDIPY